MGKCQRAQTQTSGQLAATKTCTAAARPVGVWPAAGLARWQCTWQYSFGWREVGGIRHGSDMCDLLHRCWPTQWRSCGCWRPPSRRPRPRGWTCCWRSAGSRASASPMSPFRSSRCGLLWRGASQCGATLPTGHSCPEKPSIHCSSRSRIGAAMLLDRVQSSPETHHQSGVCGICDTFVLRI